MSTIETQDEMDVGGTKPMAEHEWLNKLVGSWTTETEMTMPDGSAAKATGTETVENLGGLWALGTGKGEMPDGDTMEYRSGLGFDVSTKAYKGFWIASVSSHLWKYDCELSADGKTMTMNCVGPDMVVDGKTANYQDTIHIIDDNHRTLTSRAQDEKGDWQVFMTCRYTKTG